MREKTWLSTVCIEVTNDEGERLGYMSIGDLKYKSFCHSKAFFKSTFPKDDKKHNLYFREVV